MDTVWPKLLRYRDVGVVDLVRILHTRPPNSFNASSSSFSAPPSLDKNKKNRQTSSSITTNYQGKKQVDPRRESFETLQRYNVHSIKKHVKLVIYPRQPSSEKEDQQVSEKQKRKTGRLKNSINPETPSRAVVNKLIARIREI